MKKGLIIAVLLLAAVSFSSGAQIQWFGVGLYGPDGGALSSDWTVVLYEAATTDSLPSWIAMDGSTELGDTMLPATTVLNNPAAGGSFFDNGTYTDGGLGLTPEVDYIFTVIFNTVDFGDLSTATDYVIIDSQPFLVPDATPDPAFPYNAGSTEASGSDWNAVVPEPGTMVLFGIGAVCLGLRRRRD